MAGDEVEYPTEYMNTLANTRQTKWAEDSTEGVRKIRDALADKGSFGELPELAAYGAVFEEVRTIYLETLRGAKDDLDAVARGIRTSAQQMQDRDDQAGQAFVELWQRWENGPLASTQNHEQASSTESAQTAAQTAESAEAATTGTHEGGAPAVDEPGSTREEGAVPTGTPTSDTPPPVAGDTPGGAGAGHPRPPHLP